MKTESIVNARLMAAVIAALCVGVGTPSSNAGQAMEDLKQIASQASGVLEKTGNGGVLETARASGFAENMLGGGKIVQDFSRQDYQEAAKDVLKAGYGVLITVDSLRMGLAAGGPLGAVGGLSAAYTGARLGDPVIEKTVDAVWNASEHKSDQSGGTMTTADGQPLVMGRIYQVNGAFYVYNGQTLQPATGTTLAAANAAAGTLSLNRVSASSAGGTFILSGGLQKVTGGMYLSNGQLQFNPVPISGFGSGSVVMAPAYLQPLAGQRPDGALVLDYQGATLQSLQSFPVLNSAGLVGSITIGSPGALAVNQATPLNLVSGVAAVQIQPQIQQGTLTLNSVANVGAINQATSLNLVGGSALQLQPAALTLNPVVISGIAIGAGTPINQIQGTTLQLTPGQLVPGGTITLQPGNVGHH